VAPTLRDSQLAGQAQELREEYLAESAARLAAAGEEVEDVQQHVRKCKAPLLQQVPSARDAHGVWAWWARAGIDGWQGMPAWCTGCAALHPLAGCCLRVCVCFSTGEHTVRVCFLDASAPA